MKLREYLLAINATDLLRKTESEHTEWLDLPCRVVGNKIIVFDSEEECEAFKIITYEFKVPKFSKFPDSCMRDMTGWVKQQEREEKSRRKEQMKNLSRYHRRR